MRFSKSGAKRGSMLVALLALIAAPLSITAAPAQAAVTHLVISEAYGGGGNAGATYKNDFVELYNPTNADISLTGLSLQYRSSTNTGTGLQVLAGTVKAKSHFLVQEGAGAGGTADLPDPDATGSLNMGGTAGVVFLASGTTLVALTSGQSSTTNPAVVDLVSWGTTNTYETASGPATTNATSVSRNATRDDTDNNATDLTAGAPDPQNSGDAVDPGPGVEKTIEEVQGTAAASPLVGTKVITKGVVTAVYKTGGLKGFTIQTPGTGGALDLAEHTGSNAVFVYVSNLAAASYPDAGDYVQVTGIVAEFNGLTEIKTGSAGDITDVPDSVTAPTPASVTWPGGATARETLESMLYLPSGPWTVSDVYTLNSAGEIKLARGTTPARTPTDVARPGTPAAAAVAAQNAQRAVVLDDGATLDFFGAAKNTPLPWITQNSSVRVGAPATFDKPVIVSQFDGWKFEPTAQLDAADTNNVRPATFANTRTAGPEPVEGQLKIASVNVLNYFTQTAADWTATAGNTCTSYNDRAGTPITVNSCNGDGPRGAWDTTNRLRQQAKTVEAINALGADVVSLEEIENSAKYGPNRDAALATLVAALNDDAGSNVWSFVSSPSPAQRPSLAEQDVIRTAFIYKNAKVEPVGPSRILVGQSAFNNAREPLSQVFKPVGGTQNQQFLAVVNHFKSKGSGSGPDADQGDGQGASNLSRVNQAKALVNWVNQLKVSTSTDRVFLAGDFNSYTQEDPMKVFYDAGFTDIGATYGDDFTYVFDGAVGSLDHVLGNAAAMSTVQGASVWHNNSVESVAYEYSRYNYNATDFYAPTPYRTSDHDPLVVGFDSPPANADTVALNLLNINDFHGRIDSNTTAFATTVEQLREAAGGEDNTLFMAAGDNIGASLFASSTADDNPTIDVLNALGMEASSVGNHEFDKGFADLNGHVKNRANWTYLGANVYEKGTTTPALPEYKVITKGGVDIGVIGAVTQETPSLVTPGGISTLDFGDPVVAVNRVANQLTDGNEANGEADVLVAEFHAGAGEGTPEGATFAQELADGGEFAHIVNDLTPKVSAIFTGHTHKQYAWDAPVPGQAGKTRPIMQTGEYGNNIGQIRLVVNKNTHAVTSYSQAIVPRGTVTDTSYPRVQAVKTVVDNALAAAATIGNVVKGSVSADITTAYSGGSYVDGKYKGSNPNDPKTGRDARDLESTLGNTVADALLDSLDENGADIGIVNPGGLRDELFYKKSGAEADGEVTFAEANAVLPFVSNLWTVKITGAQLKKVLEQQWQPAGAARPFLHLGLSKNVSVTLDPSQSVGNRVTSVRVNGAPVEADDVFTVGTVAFLVTGGDNFLEFKNGTNAVDTGKVDRDAWISYISGNSPLSPRFDRREVEGTGFPTAIASGSAVNFSLSRLDLTSIGSPLNTTVTGKLDTPGADTDLGSFPVTNGAATIAFTAPATVPEGSNYVFTAQPSGTTVTIPATPSPVEPPEPVNSTTDASVLTPTTVVRYNRPTVKAQVTTGVNLPVNGGTVQILDGETILGSATVSAGSASVLLPQFRATGSYTLTVKYLGTETVNPSQDLVVLKVVPAGATVTGTVTPKPVKVGKRGTLKINVRAVTPVNGYAKVTLNGNLLGLVKITNANGSFLLPAYKTAGKKAVRVTFLGNDFVASDTVVVNFTVAR